MTRNQDTAQLQLQIRYAVLIPVPSTRRHFQRFHEPSLGLGGLIDFHVGIGEEAEIGDRRLRFNQLREALLVRDWVVAILQVDVRHRHFGSRVSAQESL